MFKSRNSSTYVQEQLQNILETLIRCTIYYTDHDLHSTHEKILQEERSLELLAHPHMPKLLMILEKKRKFVMILTSSELRKKFVKLVIFF